MSPVSRRSIGKAAIAFILFAVAIGLRLFRLAHFSLWLDEIIQSSDVHASWSGMWRSLHFQGLQAPLDYLIARVLVPFDPPDAAFKLAPAIWGALTVVSVAALLWRRAGKTAGIVAGVLLIFAPFHVRYSQEFRPYSLGLLLVTASLLSLDAYLEKPVPGRLAILYVSCLATAYTMYVAAAILAIAAAALTIEDAFDSDLGRRRAARRFGLFSPVFAVALWVGYLPWWPVVMHAIRHRVVGDRPPMDLVRITRFFSYYGFSGLDWHPLGLSGGLFLLLVVAGSIIALRRQRLRFLFAWGVGGLSVMECLEQAHPVMDSIFHYLPAGLALTLLAALPLAGLLQRQRSFRFAGAVVLLTALALDGVNLRDYYRSGRPDWRPLANTLAATPATERLFVENQYTQICLAYFIDGPKWLSGGAKGGREVLNLDGHVDTLSWAWHRDADAWLVLAAGPQYPALREWARRYPPAFFPSAEGPGGAVVRHLVNAQR
jgi:hypothetical protein